MPDSTFVISSLEQEKDYKTTSVIEGNWRIHKDSIIFDSGHIDIDFYGRKISFDFLEQFADSISYLDQGIAVARDARFFFDTKSVIYTLRGEYVRQ